MSTVLMTGGHAGLGLVGAHTLARRFGCNLILAGRSRERTEDAARRLREEIGVRVDVVVVDLDSLASVRTGAARCREVLRTGPTDGSMLDGILCNAGAQFPGPASYTEDGYERTFAGNCLGHFLLVNLLLGALAPGARIVWTASGTHDPATMDGITVGAALEPDARALARQGMDGKPVSGGRRYATSKLCTIMFAYELHRRLLGAGKPVSSIAYDPGFMPDTGMGRMAPAIFRSSAAKFVLRHAGVTMGQMPFSGEALAMLAAEPAYARASGKYFHSRNGRLSEARSSAMSYDEGRADKLWRDCEELVQLPRSSRLCIPDSVSHETTYTAVREDPEPEL